MWNYGANAAGQLAAGYGNVGAQGFAGASRQMAMTPGIIEGALSRIAERRVRNAQVIAEMQARQRAEQERNLNQMYALLAEGMMRGNEVRSAGRRQDAQLAANTESERAERASRASEGALDRASREKIAGMREAAGRSPTQLLQDRLAEMQTQFMDEAQRGGKDPLGALLEHPYFGAMVPGYTQGEQTMPRSAPDHAAGMLMQGLQETGDAAAMQAQMQAALAKAQELFADPKLSKAFRDKLAALFSLGNHSLIPVPPTAEDYRALIDESRANATRPDGFRLRWDEFPPLNFDPTAQRLADLWGFGNLPAPGTYSVPAFAQPTTRPAPVAPKRWPGARQIGPMHLR